MFGPTVGQEAAGGPCSEMEFKTLVYNAARDGKVQRLRLVLESRPGPEVRRLVGAKCQGATPLIMACRNGHPEVVTYLVGECGADLHQVGSVTFDGETIDGAPPLWCAAAAGHLKIVKYLIKMGAGCNQTTFTNSTPLRAACFDGHHDIVQYLVEHDANIEIANRHGHTCLMISCYKGHFNIVKYLLEKEADVNRKSLKGKLNQTLKLFGMYQKLWTDNHISAVLGDIDMLRLSSGLCRLSKPCATGNLQVHVVRKVVSLHEDQLRRQDIMMYSIWSAVFTTNVCVGQCNG